MHMEICTINKIIIIILIIIMIIIIIIIIILIIIIIIKTIIIKHEHRKIRTSSDWQLSSVHSAKVYIWRYQCFSNSLTIH